MLVKFLFVYKRLYLSLNITLKLLKISLFFRLFSKNFKKIVSSISFSYLVISLVFIFPSILTFLSFNSSLMTIYNNLILSKYKVCDNKPLKLPSSQSTNLLTSSSVNSFLKGFNFDLIPKISKIVLNSF